MNKRQRGACEQMGLGTKGTRSSQTEIHNRNFPPFFVNGKRVFIAGRQLKIFEIFWIVRISEKLHFFSFSLLSFHTISTLFESWKFLVEDRLNNKSINSILYTGTTRTLLGFIHKCFLNNEANFSCRNRQAPASFFRLLFHAFHVQGAWMSTNNPGGRGGELPYGVDGDACRLD